MCLGEYADDRSGTIVMIPPWNELSNGFNVIGLHNDIFEIDVRNSYCTIQPLVRLSH